MDSLIPEGIRALASQGTGWLLFCFSSAGAYVLLRLLLKSKQDCMDLSETLHEKRLEEAKLFAAAMNSTATALTDLHNSMDQRTLSLNSLVALGTQTERSVGELLRRMEELQRRQP